jgi:hypothetical protein
LIERQRGNRRSRQRLLPAISGAGIAGQPRGKQRERRLSPALQKHLGQRPPVDRGRQRPANGLERIRRAVRLEDERHQLERTRRGDLHAAVGHAARVGRPQADDIGPPGFEVGELRGQRARGLDADSVHERPPLAVTVVRPQHHRARLEPVHPERSGSEKRVAGSDRDGVARVCKHPRQIALRLGQLESQRIAVRVDAPSALDGAQQGCHLPGLER